MNNRIAVLLPVYKQDNPEYFKLSLESILAQNCQDVMVLIGVDGYVDGDLAQYLTTLEKYDDVKVIYFDQNRGLACVLNDLIAIGRQLDADFYARMDADDICLPDRFAKQLDYLLSYPDVDIVGGSIAEIDDEGRLNGKVVGYPPTHDECRRFFRYRDPVAHPATFFRKRFFEKCHGYRPEYRKNQDTMLWYDAFRAGCVFANVQETVLQFRVTSDFYCRRNGLKRACQMLRSRMEINRGMHYDVTAYVFAVAMACMTIAPTWIKKWLYKLR